MAMMRAPALLDKVRALDALPRLNALRMLDRQGNDLKASKYNITFETLDFSEKPFFSPSSLFWSATLSPPPQQRSEERKQ
ncbi:hypothetical protein H0H92_004947 [Tricholoma furcatifolium]|nr:hypothetical protein H0H92_004947 [Tricholoma furcatifolium]